MLWLQLWLLLVVLGPVQMLLLMLLLLPLSLLLLLLLLMHRLQTWPTF